MDLFNNPHKAKVRDKGLEKMIFLLPLERDNVIIVWILTTFNRFHKLVRILLYPVDTSDRLCAVSAAKNRPGNPVKP